MVLSRLKLLRDVFIYTILPKISFVASLLALPFITPYLSLNDYGIYGIISAYVVVFQITSVLGQNIVLQNSFFTHKDKYKLVWRRVFAILVITGLISSLIFGLILYTTLASKTGSNTFIVFLLVSIYFIFSCIDTITANYYVFKEKAIAYALGAAFSGLSSIACVVIAIRYFHLGYLGWVITLPVSAVANFIYYFRTIFISEKIFPQFYLKKRFLKKALKVGLPLTPHQLSLYILGISDRLILEYLRIPVRNIGFYSQGYNMGSQGSVIVSGVFQAFSKKIQDAFRNSDAQSISFIKRFIIVVPLAISIFFFIVSIWMREVFLLLFRRAELQAAYSIAIVVLCSYMYWGLYNIFTYPLSILNKTFSVSKISLIAAIFNLAGNFILIPFIGIWASVIVTYISYMIFGFAGLLNTSNRQFINKYVNITKVCVNMFMLNSLLTVTAFLIKDINIFYKLAVTALCLAGSYLLFTKNKTFTKSY